MKSRKEKIQVALILFVVIGALAFSIAGFVGAFRNKASDSSQTVPGSSISQSEASENETSSIPLPDSQEASSEEKDATSQDSSDQQATFGDIVTDEEASDFLAALYGSDMFGAEQPKDLLENEELMASLQEYGMSEEEIRAAINEMQAKFEENKG